MNQSLLALAALICVTLLAFSSYRARHHQERWAARGEVEARAATLGAELLDMAALAPAGRQDVDPAAAGERTATESAALGPDLPLSDWGGREDSVAVTLHGRPLLFVVRATVEAVEKAGGVFVPSPTPGPYYRLRLDIAGALDVRTTVERVYSYSGV